MEADCSRLTFHDDNFCLSKIQGRVLTSWAPAAGVQIFDLKHTFIECNSKWK